jgi:hypothetical protein
MLALYSANIRTLTVEKLISPPSATRLIAARQWTPDQRLHMAVRSIGQCNAQPFKITAHGQSFCTIEMYGYFVKKHVLGR